MKFTLEIEMNSSVAMRTRVDIESALQDAARQFHLDGLPSAGELGEVRAINGNTVGKWKLTERGMTRYDYVTADAIGKYLVVGNDGEAIAEAVSEHYAMNIAGALNAEAATHGK